ncbi:class I SAM-dependent methyltransferase [Streptomyces aureocirculatus]|uniref:class I SAM-dependent methyltransferase n=1 Tax=Streptomyces aureocirculatus TaxID=67275 RepID=UPI0004C6991E|nr:class I SAM-dependent methyltransferase [Streptomyces aureocirculatus]
MPESAVCRICGGEVVAFMDFGEQPVSDCFLPPGSTAPEHFYQLVVGACSACAMVQLLHEVPRERMFHEDYPYHSSGSAHMREHFRRVAEHFLAAELTGDDAFIVELGCNDGVMLKTVAEAGVRHLGVEPSGSVADITAARGIRVRKDFFEEATAREILAEDGKAAVIYAANTLCHIPYMGSVLDGVRELLTPHGVFVFEDPYFADIVRQTSFDQMYDEHFYYFTARSVAAMARGHGLELVDVERLPVHGGEVRYTLAREGARAHTGAVDDLLAAEDAAELTARSTLEAFADRVRTVRADLTALLRDLRARGEDVVGYGATAKSATVLNYCGIGPDLIEYVTDSTPAKQGRLTPGSHIPVVPPQRFADAFPRYAVLFAWNHAEEIMAKEEAFREAGGRWIRYVPGVRVD